MSRFKAIYIAAIAVILLGAFGSIFVPKAHAASCPSVPFAPALAAVVPNQIIASTDLALLAGLAGTGCLSLAGLMVLASVRK
jgi:hypothetical protein